MKLQARAATDSFRLNSKSEPPPLSSCLLKPIHNDTTSPNITIHNRFLFDQCISANPAVLIQDMVDKTRKKEIHNSLSRSLNLIPLQRKCDSSHYAMIFERYSVFPKNKSSFFLPRKIDSCWLLYCLRLPVMV